jgi:hypothetical protein
VDRRLLTLHRAWHRYKRTDARAIRRTRSLVKLTPERLAAAC